MKKIIPRLIILFVSLLAPGLLFSQTSKLITQLKVTDNDSTFRFVYYYDNNNNKVLETKYFLKDFIWNKLTQTEWLYNNNQCEIQRERKYISNEWVTVHEIRYTYQNDQLISETHLKFKNSMEQQYKMLTFNYNDTELTSKKEFYLINNQLFLRQLTENTYNNNLLVSTLIKKVSSIPSEIKDYRLSFEYNSNNILVAQLLEEKNGNNEWVNLENGNWYYGNSNKVSSQRTKKWNQTNSVWENSTMIDFDYNSNNQIVEEVYYRWSTMFWEKTVRYYYEYNTDGSLLTKTLMLPIYRQWRRVSSINYSDFQNEKANMMETVLSFWGGNSSDKQSANIPFLFNNDIEIKKGNQIIISYEKIDNTDISTFSLSNGLTIHVYPNPSEDYFYFNPENYQVTSWSVYDLKGRIIKQQNYIIRTGIIDLSNAPKGIYFLKVTTLDKVLSQKLIKK